MALVPSIVLTGFISSGKSTFVHQLLQDKKKRFAFVFDCDVLPDNILFGFEDSKIITQDIAIELNSGSSICCTLDEESLTSTILNHTDSNGNLSFDFVIFVNNSFESSFLAELLSCIDEGPLSILASKINLTNIVCLLDCSTAIVNLKSKQLLKDRFKSEFEDVEIVSAGSSHTHTHTDGACCHPSNDTVKECTVNSTSSQKPQFLSVPLTQQALAASNSSMMSGSTNSLSGSRKKTVCCPDQGEKNCCQNKQQQQIEEQSKKDDSKEDVNEKLVNKGDKPVSALVFDQLSCSSIAILNKIDLVEEDEVNFLESLVKLISPNVKVLKTELAKIENIEQLFGEPSPIVRDYQPLDLKMSGIFITHFYQRVPFHPERLFKFIYSDEHGKKINSKTIGNVLYLNGFIWLATDMKMNYSFEVNAGYELFTYGNQFYSTLNENEWPLDSTAKESIDRDIKLFKYQDRKTEISIVGIESNTMNKAKFIDQLQKCLLTEEELAKGPNEWENLFKNPFADILVEEDEDDADEN